MYMTFPLLLGFLSIIFALCHIFCALSSPLFPFLLYLTSVRKKNPFMWFHQPSNILDLQYKPFFWAPASFVWLPTYFPYPYEYHIFMKRAWCPISKILFYLLSQSPKQKSFFSFLFTCSHSQVPYPRHPTDTPSSVHFTSIVLDITSFQALPYLLLFVLYRPRALFAVPRIKGYNSSKST
jgi:hypothetical protein